MMARTFSFLLAILPAVLCFFIPLNSAGNKKYFYILLAGTLICFLFWGWTNYGLDTQIIGIILMYFFWGAAGGLVVCLLFQFLLVMKKPVRSKRSRPVRRTVNDHPVSMDEGPASGI